MRRVVLAYSGGLDTSVAVRWLMEHRDAEVIAVAVDVGQRADQSTDSWDAIRARALAAGAVEAIVVDARREMAEEFCFAAVRANARYEGKYPLVSALSRPVIVRHLVKAAREHGADAVAHGCTGKGNDQVRFEVGTRALAPDLDVIAPARVWGLTREECVEYAAKWDIPIEVTKDKLYSIDENLWGKSIECGVLEDPWASPPEDIYTLTKVTATGPVEVVVGFEHGVPVSLDGVRLDGHDLITRLGVAAGSTGFGRLDMVENRRVGIKSREIYEAPAAVALIGAHQEVEFLTLPRELLQHKTSVEQAFAQVVYNGQWFSPLRAALSAYLQETQKAVTGEVRLLLEKGRAVATGRRSPQAVYDQSLATYSAGDTFDHSAAVGFITIYGMQSQAYAKAQSKAKAAAHAG